MRTHQGHHINQAPPRIYSSRRPPLKLEDSRSESAGNSRVPSLEGVPSFTEAGRHYLEPLGKVSANKTPPSGRRSASVLDHGRQATNETHEHLEPPLSTRSQGANSTMTADGRRSSSGGSMQNDNAGLAPQERLSRKERHEIMKRSKERSTVTAKVDSNNVQWGGGGDADKRALDVVYKAFGNEFVVAATERKRRPLPKKRRFRRPRRR